MLPLIILFFHSLQVISATTENSTEICASFSTTQNLEFTSPWYPELYPANVQCTKLIEAPPTAVIRLHFIEYFQLEWSPEDPTQKTCYNDYLEIRDGQFGYSSLVNKICGTTPPIYVESSGPFLWLRFKSDYNIEYGGFKIRIEFVERIVDPSETPPPCTFNIALDKNFTVDTTTPNTIPMEIINASLTTNYQIDCTWIVTAPEDHKIYLQFIKYKLHSPNDCEFNFVEIYGAKTELEGVEGRLKQFCSSDSIGIVSPGNVLHLRFFSVLEVEKRTLKSFFVAYFGVVRGIEGDAVCDKKTEIDCMDNTCIPISQKCDKIPNCKSQNDEEDNLCGANKDFQLKTNILIIAFLGILLMSGMCSGLLLNVYRKLMQDRMEMKEIMRQSLKSHPHRTSSSSKSTSENPTVIMATNVIPYIPPKPYLKREDNTDAIREMRDSSCQTSSQQRPSDVLVWIK